MRNYKAVIAFAFVIMLACSSIVLSNLWKDKSTVTKVNFFGNTTLSKDEVFDFAKLSDSLICSNTLTLDMIESRIAKHPNIKKVSVTRESVTIDIEISEKSPFAIASNGKDLFLVDDKLSLYPFKKEQRDIDLPVISGLSPDLSPDIFGKGDLKNLHIAQYIISQAIRLNKSLYNYISEICFADSSLLMLYSSDDGVPIYMLDYAGVSYSAANSQLQGEIVNPDFRKEIDRKLVYLNNFLKQVRVYKTTNSFAYVDLRYKDILIVKNNKLPATD